MTGRRGRRGRLVAVAGPSGVGKSTLVAEVLRRRPDLWLSVSATTRTPRPGEQPGVEYNFVSEATFEDMRRRGELLECAEFAGSWYGTPVRPVLEHLESGRDAILEIDVQGVRQVRDLFPEVITVFIAPPSLAELERRLAGRGTEGVSALRARLEAAGAELTAAAGFDQCVINSDVKSAVERLLALIPDPAPGP